MGQESDDIVSLPAPPPPNPAARRSAIDTAMRKFDGVEEPAKPRRRPSPWQWASTHRRATGGLVTAALIAVVGIPAIQVALRNQPQDIASEQAEPSLPTADVQAVDSNAATDTAAPPVAEPASGQPATALPMARNEPAAAPEESRALAKQAQPGFTDARPEQKARAATTAPLISAPASPMASVNAAPPPPAPPPPPPPPPPAPMAEREAADAVAAESGSIIVTGQMARRQNTRSAAPVTASGAEQAEADFEIKLRTAFATNNRQAILALIAYPLKVDFNGDVRTYRTRNEVERDFARIFTSEVRGAVLSGQAARHLTLASQCSRTPCAPGSNIKIRAVRP